MFVVKADFITRNRAVLLESTCPATSNKIYTLLNGFALATEIIIATTLSTAIIPKTEQWI